MMLKSKFRLFRLESKINRTVTLFLCFISLILNSRLRGVKFDNLLDTDVIQCTKLSVMKEMHNRPERFACDNNAVFKKKKNCGKIRSELIFKHVWTFNCFVDPFNNTLYNYSLGRCTLHRIMNSFIVSKNLFVGQRFAGLTPEKTGFLSRVLDEYLFIFKM